MKKQVLCALVLTAFAGLFAAETSEIAAGALQKVTPGTIAMKDANNWLYSKNELEHLSKGSLANGAVAKVSAAKKNSDPIPALVKFNEGLKALGIKLILVPVPPKAAVAPFTGLKKGEAMAYLKPFYDELRAKGINVLDMSDVFLKSGKENLYCRTDAHWSPAGIAIAAEELAKQIDAKGAKQYAVKSVQQTIAGDLAKSLNASAPETEEITLQVVADAIDETSSVLLIGDSHTLIFSTGGDMLSNDAGLAEALAAKLGMPVDRMGVKGSAATAVRINLFRKGMKNKAWLKNKKYVIYCFSCREFTESSSGWAQVPVTK